MPGNRGRMVTLLRAERFFRAFMYTRTHKHSIDVSPSYDIWICKKSLCNETCLYGQSLVITQKLKLDGIQIPVKHRVYDLFFWQ